ncbi:MAG: hypothetical protein A3G39_05900 [Deltaproteobacteria bacterium RIFCSPLOWO2_12_FULL_43_16]|nr:MAG: hypothetical protein A2Z89_03470 [Deltaproteobacteria bacterium GWA2_43_19]OGQ11634.1 MAG: hypothetical protein A3D30_02495 [Deltaproteobacteria bacterium RIFCSPHIGHO2_02_FULL_43_33]OGQ44134.1 MAG: hypothetical protein A3A85_00490 [Deltaproteobacteria bacterium RIFCSPLOWO2_01_FULL_42_9]OGQ60681.1 MAG: hypothetical protein A3G39_05900 [Deltaproteobacteria bacterium RIFCSPLOWO2_12_FULL_43_16]HBR17488.1 dihydroorotate dehydrogenase electron transfer subunit [Deltaproteobacteria bacterium]
MTKRNRMKVLYNKQILPDYYKLGISWKDSPDIEPGQFVMLRLTGRIDPLLRRPFGIYKILGQGIEILYRVVGKGTRLMTDLKSGGTVDVLGPLGNNFPVDKHYKEIIMVAGGIGIVPFYTLVEKLKVKGSRSRLLFGGRGKDDLPGLEDFKKLGIDISISTDDGSVGKKGFVTKLLKKELSKNGDYVIYACGSKGMLKEVARITDEADAPCYVSLDQAMACGIGACLGCAIKVRGARLEVRGKDLKNIPEKYETSNLKPQTSNFYKMVCKDGPVFDAKEIAWEEI